MQIQHPSQLIPAYARKATEEKEEVLKRILLIGRSGHGKTTSSCLGTKNIMIADAENNIPPELLAREDIYILPFHDPDWIKKAFPGSANAWDAMMRYIEFDGDGRKLTQDWTLVLDSLSAFSDILEAKLTPLIPKGQSDKENGFWFWKEWAKNLADFCGRIKRLQCNVVLTTHEHELIEVDTGKVLAVRWWLPGQQFTPRIPQFFTDVFRQIRKLKPGAAGVTSVNYEYVWQINATTQFPSAKTTIKSKLLEVPATWESFKLRDK